MRKVSLAALAISLFVSLGMNLYLSNLVSEFEKKPLFHSGDENIIHSAVQYWASYERITHDGVMVNRFPVTMRLPDRRCVELRLTTDAAGGSPVFCFKKGTDQLISTFVTGE